MESKYISCMLCHAIGDAIGYKNSEWEFMFNYDKIYQFIALGGINHIDTKDWHISDDTMLHVQMADALVHKYNDGDDLSILGNAFKNNLLDALEEFHNEGYAVRNPGDITIRNLFKLQDGLEWNGLEYDHEYGGNGAAMRNLCIGLAFYKPSDFDKLIEISIEMSRVTHNSVIGYLGGFVSALFTSYALQNIDIKKWPFLLMDLYKNKTIEKYIKKKDRDVEEYYKYAHIFFNKWATYIQDKFDENGNVIEKRTTINLIWRSRYYTDNYRYKKDSDLNNYTIPGGGGDDVMIIAYDSLLDAGNKWETLVFYAMLHVGDTDTTGCIAAGLYGIIYGMNDIPKINYENLEFKDLIIDMGKQLYKKFYKS